MLSLKDQIGNTPLHYCVTGRRDDMLSVLVQHDVDLGSLSDSLPNFCNISGSSNRKWSNFISFSSSETQLSNGTTLIMISFVVFE